MKKTSKRLLSLVLSLVLILSLTGPAFAANGEENQAEPVLTWEKVSSGRAEPLAAGVAKTAEPERDPAEMVRVSIILNDESTLAMGYSTKKIADNTAAMNYRAGLKAKQNALADKISREILRGDKLDVVWNITLAANMISANVPYGTIEAIKALDEVRTVVLEARYEPEATVEEEADEPNMYRATLQTGTDKVWAEGITGAGSRVAVIDTGVNHNHTSNAAAALEYSYSLNAEAKGMTLEAYMASLNLLTADEIAAKAENLNAPVNPGQAYVSTKVPYAYNYVDGDYDVTHANDTQGNHGSHVAGIEAANKYVASGSGFTEAVNGSNKIKGQAYDAQIINMKVFGKNGGAYDSDYMVAIEDAIILGCDSANLSLGSSSAGFATDPEYQSILDSLANSDIVVSISMGNSYQWSYAAGVSSRNIYADDANYFTGGSPGSFANAFTVASVGSANYNTNGRYTMSSFSSWGVPSDLSLKPEITTPGGSIVSVNGTNNSGFTTMSGTSMAAPQAGGIAGLLGQYIRENDILTAAKKTNADISMRQLRQSLIMSTAVPIHMNNNGYIYYPVIQQGAGMARVDKAMASKTYVLIDPASVGARAPLSAVSNVKDGKVKVELGDDPDYLGVYSTAFTLNNLTEEDVIYELGADFFTQNITTSGGNSIKAMTVVNLTSNNVWTVDGKPIEELTPAGLFDLNGDEAINALDAQVILDYVVGNIEAIPVNPDKADIDGDGDVDTYDAHLLLKKLAEAQAAAPNRVTVPAGGSVKIGLTFDLKDSIDRYSNNGNYVEGYINAKEVVASGEGVDHSIPVMGYYGSWTDPSMFNKGSYLAYTYGGETRTPYLNSILGSGTARALQTFLVRYAGEEFGTPIGGNPVVSESYYDADRNALAPAFGDEIFSIHYSAIRNSAGSRFRVMQDGAAEPIAEIIGGSAYGAYYNPNDGSWYNTNAMPDINYFIPSSVPNNTKLTLSFELAPEYYVKADGTIDWDALHDGAKISLPVTVDNEEPAIVDVSVATSDMSGARKLIISAKDNQYVARFRILKEDGTVLLEQGSDRNASAGDAYNVSYAITDDTITRYLVEVTDYALNVGTYRINLNKDELVDPEITITLDKTDFEIIGKNSTSITATVNPWGVTDDVTWTTSDPAVATVNGRGVVTGVETGTAVITATSVAYPEVSASATVHVRFIEKTLNGIVCDENGAAYVIEFNMRNLPTYQTLHEEPLSDWVYETAVDRNGTVYVSTYDGSSQSPLYTLNLQTMELTQIGTGTSRTYYTDIEAAGDNLYGLNVLLGVYSTNLYTINKSTSARASQISMRNYTGTGSLVGITFHKSEGDVDYYYMLTQAGIVYDVGLKLNDAGTGITVVGAEQVLDYGYTADTNYWQDLYYDGESLYWSRIDLGISRVDLIMAKNLTVADKETKIIRAGSFAVDVWPVGGLFELNKVPGYQPPEPEPDPDPEPEPTEPDYYLFGWINGADYACEGDAENLGIYKFENGSLTATFTENSYVAVKTGDNAHWYMTNGWLGEEVTSAVLYDTTTLGEGAANKLYVPGSVAVTFNLAKNEDGTLTLSYEPADTATPEDLAGNGSLNAVTAEQPDDASAGKTILIKADEPTTNGLLTITFPETVTFVSAESSALKAIKAETGKVVLSYAAENAFETGSLVALLTFTDTSEGDVTIATNERNNEHFEDETVVVTLGASNAEPQEPVYGEPTWVWSADYSMANAVFTPDSGEDLILPADVTSETTEAFCEEAGAVVYTAEVEFNGETFTDVKTVELPAIGHAWGEPVWTWNEELTEAAAKFVCANDETHVQEIPAEITEAITLEPTDQADGEKTITAKVVFNETEFTDVKTVAIPKLSLADGFYLIGVNGWTTADLTAADKFEPNPENENEFMLQTALAVGNEIKVVKVAKDAIAAWYPSEGGNYVVDEAHSGNVVIFFSETYKEEWVTFGGHIYIEAVHVHTPGEPVIENAAEPTCTEPGSHDEVVFCTVCGEELSRETVVDPALGHDPQTVEEAAPTCTEPGHTAGVICARCGEILEGLEEIPAAGHTIVIDAAVAATCTETGLTAGVHCSVCNEILIPQNEIPALGHDPKAIPAVAPTCTEPGSTEGSVCARCGEILTAPEEVEALGHDYEAVVTAPTCVDAGFTTYTCSRCGDSYVADEAEALGHEFSEWAVTKEPTCVEAGEESRMCARCLEVETRPVNPLGHDAELIPAVAPTCTETGLTVGVRCKVCGEILIAQEVVEATGHAYGDPAWTWNEELTEATAKFICANDPAHVEELKAVITEEVTVAPTDKAEGEKTVTAAVEFNGETYTDVKTVVLEKLEHDCPCAAFTDMPEFGTVEHDAIDWAFTHDPQITKGTSDTTFGPEKTVTRGQAVTFLWRAAGCPEPTSTEHTFTDVKETGYYYKAMLWAVEKGITTGTSATRFSPNKTCTIEQILTFIYRYMEEPEVQNTENPWTDVNGDGFSFKAIMWAVENGIVAPKSETVFGRKDDCTRASIVTFLYRIMTGEGLVE